MYPAIPIMTVRFAPALPGFVSFVQLHVDDGPAAPLLQAEAALLHPRATAARRVDFQLGRAAAHTALNVLGRESGPLLRGDHREPLWPTGIVGSITHTAGYALAATAYRERSGGIGIDLEHRERSFAELAEFVAFDEELAWLEAVPPEKRRRATLELFSAKESIFKAFFPRVGSFFGYRAARVRPLPTGGFEGFLVAALDAEYPADRAFFIGCEWRGDFVLTTLVLPV